jgi:hypothetical protein
MNSSPLLFSVVLHPPPSEPSPGHFTKDPGSQHKTVLEKLSFDQYKGWCQRNYCMENSEMLEMIMMTCLEELDQKGYYLRDQEMKVDANSKCSQESGH